MSWGRRRMSKGRRMMSRGRDDEQGEEDDKRGGGWLAEGEMMIFVCFVALRPKSTAMVIAGRSVHLTTHFPGQV